MVGVVYALKILFYFMFVALLFISANSKHRITRFTLNSRNLLDYDTKKQISFVLIIISSAIIGYYAIICGQKPYVSDRESYAFRFSNAEFSDWVKNDSLGIFVIECVLHFFTNNPDCLFFTISFLCLSVTLITYNRYEGADKNCLLFLGLSSYVYYSFFILKQASATAFISLAFAYYFKGKKIPFIISLIIAICFHESAWIMIPIFFLLRYSDSKTIRRGFIIALIVGVVLFDFITMTAIRVFSIIPGISSQLAPFVDANTGKIIRSGTGIITSFKGAPYFYILFWGIIRKRDLENKIKNYNAYIIVLSFVSATFLMSQYMYWMWRFGSLCYFPCFVFASMLCQKLGKKDRQILFFPLVIMFSLLTLYALYEYYYVWGGF